MIELDYRPAYSVCLYAGHVILRKQDTPQEDSDIHGGEYGVIAGWSIKGESLADVLATIGMQSYPLPRPVAGNRYETTPLRYVDLPILHQEFTTHWVEEIQVAETGYGGLRIRVAEECEGSMAKRIHGFEKRAISARTPLNGRPGHDLTSGQLTIR